MKNSLLLTLVIVLLGSPLGAGNLAASADDISGTWIFSVDLENGGHGDPTFVFNQKGESLTGSYNGPLGEYKVTGTVKGNKAVFWFEFSSQDGETLKATYTGTIETSVKMTGTVEFTKGPRGKWTATKK
ncbi:MAG: hypothetical protein L0226_15160 [Acidobacteria bacterium]|nr:hypothetical protein [Acidobacteriota bacterium]